MCAVFSCSIDLSKGLQAFQNLVYRLARLSRAQKGYDMSAKVAKPPDVTMLEACSPENAYLKVYHQWTLENRGAYPIYKARFQRTLLVDFLPDIQWPPKILQF